MAESDNTLDYVLKVVCWTTAIVIFLGGAVGYIPYDEAGAMIALMAVNMIGLNQ